MNLNDLSQRLKEFANCGLHVFHDDGTLETISFGRVWDDVADLKHDLEKVGLGDRCVVGLVGPNSYTWIVADLSLLSLGCIPVCIPEHVLTESGLEELAVRYELECLLFTDKSSNQEELEPWCAVIGSTLNDVKLRARSTAQTRWSHDVLTLVFSSGTTGVPKCLVVSKHGLENTITVTGEAWRVRHDDNIFITLPFSNLQQRWMLYMAIWFGFDVSLAPTEKLYRALRRLTPTIVLGPPGFFEELEKRYYAKKFAFKWWRVPIARCAALLPGALRSRVRRALFADLLALFGSKARLMFVGSAPTRRSMLRTLQFLGFPIFEVYGLTEFGWISFNLPGQNNLGSVGRPVEGVTVIIDANRQVVVEGTAVQTLGYAFGREQEQRAVYLSDNRVATGDTGYLDNDGSLHLDGRLKNIIATRGGLKMSPEAIEAKLEEIESVSRAVVFGGGELPSLVCVAFSDRPIDRAFEAALTAAIGNVSSKLPIHERIGRVVVRPANALTEQSGMLTRNLKLNRSKILETYYDEVVRG